MKLHDFTNKGFGNNLENSGACWSHRGAVRSGDFFKTEGTWYKALEAKPCGDPKDMSFIKTYMTIAEEEPGDIVTVKVLEDAYQKYCKDKKTIHSFPLKGNTHE